MSRNHPEKPGKRASDAELRQQKLAEALRANLKRRKAVKVRADPDTPGKPPETKE